MFPTITSQIQEEIMEALRRGEGVVPIADMSRLSGASRQEIYKIIQRGRNGVGQLAFEPYRCCSRSMRSDAGQVEAGCLGPTNLRLIKRL